MDSNPILHPSPAKEMKCYFLYYVQLLMISQACWWTQTPSTTCLQPKNEMLIFWLCSASDDWPGWSMDSNPICHPSSAKKWNAHIFITFNFWCWPDWSMDSNPIHHPSPAKKNEMLLFRLRSLLMICLADWWTWTPSNTPLLPKKWNAQFSFTFNFWWSARLTNGLKPHLPALSSQKHEMLIFVLHLISDVGQTCQWTQTLSTTPLQPKKWNASFLDYTQLLMIGQAEWWTQTPSTIPLQPIKWNAHFWITFNFWWLAGLVDGLKPHPPPISSQ